MASSSTLPKFAKVPKVLASEIIYKNENEIGISDPYSGLVLAFPRGLVERAVIDDGLYRNGGLPDTHLVTAGGDSLARVWNALPNTKTRFVETDALGNLTIPPGRAVTMGDILPTKSTSAALSSDEQIISLARETMSAEDIALTLFKELKHLKNISKKRRDGFEERKRKRAADEASKSTREAIKAYKAGRNVNAEEDEEEIEFVMKKKARTDKGKGKARQDTSPVAEEASGSGFGDSGLDQMEIYGEPDGAARADDAADAEGAEDDAEA
ncbi:hypothetical protein K435DRAFT_906287 [Dendrothele bispora CBS 962.96]|uniref:Uncharacterized protein n=1 Tax=Dendrothele bispora (strain CBS 962.96) TaxID=1314807 RepID=A0A4S8LSJ4_DENBC|nr:hypothetical protein K435DRAFT_906287 [Dendrothele bispora CBS 962.96]